MTPIIGIASDYRASGSGEARFRIGAEYFDAVASAGATPLLLPPVSDPAEIEEQMRRIDGLLIPGGLDTPPSHYGQRPHPATRPVHPKRDDHDFACLEVAFRLKKPVLGICYGMQLLNVVSGGTLIQDLPPPGPTTEQHRREGKRSMHSVTVVPQTRLHKILGCDRLQVNSSHHQAIDRLGDGLNVSARSDDGIIEAIETTGSCFILGVQWHPEAMTDRPEHLALFRALIDSVPTRGL